jgi:uncharacterized RDD family membrane protein YckC
MSAAPGLTVGSDTGIDVSLAVAGPGARAYAFVVDWHIRVVLALAWFALSALLVNGAWSLRPATDKQGLWLGLVVLPSLALYFLYHYVLEPLMHGRTPGKRLAGVRIAARDGTTPSAGALLTRNVFRIIDCLPACYCLGLMCTLLTREHVRVGDMAAGTLLVYEHSAAGPPLELAAPSGAAPHLDAAGAEVVTELLARWQTLAPSARTTLARQALGRYGATASSAEQMDEPTLRGQLERLLHGVRQP